MCGIAGWIDWERDMTQEKTVLEVMTEKLSPRGPDASGLWFSPHASLGHRRLIVVDPQGGEQPMTRRYGEHTGTITYNGELYNTIELRRELESLGHFFTTHNSDTEVLLKAYQEWGANCLDRFNGIFAFAIWDEATQSLFMARDRLGVKPLFYTQKNSSFLFASELKALLAHPNILPELDEEGLTEIFIMGPARTPGHGIYRGINELKPGHYLVYNRRGIKVQRYWHPLSKVHEDDLEGTATKVYDLLKDTVRRQLVSDVPVCTLLSGGLDSSALTAFAAEFYRENGADRLHTFSVDYRDNERYFQAGTFQPDADARWVDRVAGFLGTEHHKVVIDTPQLVEALTMAVKARDLPGMADVDSSLLLFCREIKKEATVALSGEAADEIFGGYPWFHNPEILNRETFPWVRSLSERLELLSPQLREILRPEEYLQSRYRETIAAVPSLPGENPLEKRRREMFYLNMIWFMTTLLDRKDRMSMACGLEVRVPFCDHRLVEYVWNIPWEIKTCHNREKGILRHALQNTLPGDVLYRKKSPYPKTHHPAYRAAVQKWLLEILDDPASPILPLIDAAAVHALVEKANNSTGQPWFGQLMTYPQFMAYLIQINIWLQEYGVKIF